MTDLAERFARTQGWTWHEAPWGSGLDRIVGEPHWCSPEGQCLAKPAETIDERILPIIWADCKAQEWGCKMEYTPWLEPAGHSATVCVDPGWKEYKVFSDDPVAALCEAYCKAVESAR